MTLRIRQISTVAALLLVAVAWRAPATAHAETKLTASPAIIRTTGDAGDQITEKVTLIAGDDQAMVVEFGHADYGFDGRTYAPVIIRDTAEDTTSFSTRGWFSIATDRVRIPAGKSVRVPLEIRIPENTPSGTYVGVALFRVRADDGSVGAVQAVPETGSVIFVNVSGGAPPKAKIKAFDVPRFTTSQALYPRIVVDNVGSQVFTVTGKVRVPGAGTDGESKITQQYVMPHRPRELRARSQGERFELQVPSAWPRLRTVELRVRISPTNATVVDRHRVLVIPAWFIVALLLLLVAAVAGSVAWWRRRRDALAVAAERGDTDDDADGDDDEGSSNGGGSHAADETDDETDDADGDDEIDEEDDFEDSEDVEDDDSADDVEDESADDEDYQLS